MIGGSIPVCGLMQVSDGLCFFEGFLAVGLVVTVLSDSCGFLSLLLMFGECQVLSRIRRLLLDGSVKSLVVA